MEESPSRDTRKRSASPVSHEKSCKRSRWNDATVENEHVQNIVPTTEPPLINEDQQQQQSGSVEAMLSVPLEIIFRESPPTSLLSMTQQKQQTQQQHHHHLRHKPLLARAEAQTLIRTSQLAFELDVLVQLTSDALSDKLWCRSMSQKLELQRNNPFLKPLMPLLAIHGDVVPNAALLTFQTHLDLILMEMEKNVVALRQHAEQNWTVAESLMDALGYALESAGTASPLALEKRMLGDIEEEVCRRIESLLGIVSNVPSLDASKTTDQEEEFGGMSVDVDLNVSMEEYCNKLFGLETAEPSTPLLRDDRVAESHGRENRSSISNDFDMTDSPSKDNRGGTTVIASSPEEEDDDEQEATEQRTFEPSQESFEPSQERNPSTCTNTATTAVSCANEKKMFSTPLEDTATTATEASDSCTKNAAEALSVMMSSGDMTPCR